MFARRISNAHATISLGRSCIGMTHLTFDLAATHDHWFEEPAAKHALPALKLSWRHFAKHHPIMADLIAWSSCGVLAAGLIASTLIANA